MAATSPRSPQSAASGNIPPLRRSQFVPDQTPLQRLFQTILEGSREKWMYVIYWEYSAPDYLLRWGDGYYNFEKDNGKARKASSPAEQAQRKSFLRLLNIFVLGPSALHDDWDSVTDLEWNFLLSMGQTFVNGTGKLGHAFLNSSPVWLTGPGLSESACQRARQLHEYGLQTMVCIPCPNGVVELASTEVVLPDFALFIKVRDLVNFKCPVADLTSGEILRPR